MRPLQGEGFTGAEIVHGPRLHDIALAVDADAVALWDGVKVQGRAAMLRYRNDAVAFYFVRQGRHLAVPAAAAFESAAPISIVMQGRSGVIISPGTEITFTLDRPAEQVLLDGEPLAARAGHRQWTLHVPEGTHRIHFGD